MWMTSWRQRTPWKPAKLPLINPSSLESSLEACDLLGVGGGCSFATPTLGSIKCSCYCIRNCWSSLGGFSRTLTSLTSRTTKTKSKNMTAFELKKTANNEYAGPVIHCGSGSMVHIFSLPQGWAWQADGTAINRSDSLPRCKEEHDKVLRIQLPFSPGPFQLLHSLSYASR